MTPPGPVAFFTGAGISVGSGLPTYRGTGGIYEDSDPDVPHARDLTPERLPALWAKFGPRLTSAQEVRPSAAHRAVAEFGETITTQVVTQNVDGLHRDAGSDPVHELHGSLREVRCIPVGHVTAIGIAARDADGVPRCPLCDAVTRPNVVLFGESLPTRTWDAAQTAMRNASTVVAVGTSAQVYPAAGLVSYSIVGSASLVWVNPETPPPGPGWRWLEGSADDIVPALLDGWRASGAGR